MKAKVPTYALITGASSGIGKELAYLLAKKNIQLILHGRNQEELAKIAALLSKSVKVEIFSVDLADSAQRATFITEIKKLPIDLLINNAGFGLYGCTLDYSIAEVRAMIEVNAIAAFELTYAIASNWLKNGQSGTILNVSSVAGEIVMPLSNTYSASKAFLTHFSRGLDAELQNSGIRILTSAPGQIATDFARRASGKAYKDFSQKSVMTAAYAAEQIWKQILQQKSYQIFNWKYQLLTSIIKIFIPQVVLNYYLKRRIKERIES